MNIEIRACEGIPNLAITGLHYDRDGNQLYIVDPDGSYFMWGMEINFQQHWDAQSINLANAREAGPGPVEHIDQPREEIRGLCADDIKELIAMSHEAAAVELVKKL